jgi:hypothetical protein
MNKNNYLVLSISLLAMLVACKKPLQTSSYYETNFATGQTVQRTGLALPQKQANYPIDVFFKPNKPSFEIEYIEEISINFEEINTEKEALANGRMVQRGKTAEEKKLLIDALIQKAENLGASCLIDVNYQYFTSVTTSGYSISGIAGKYSLKNIQK